MKVFSVAVVLALSLGCGSVESSDNSDAGSGVDSGQRSADAGETSADARPGIDAPPGFVTVSIADAETSEGDYVGEVALEIALDEAADGEVTVEVATADGTAVAGDDYVASSDTVTFAPGETSKLFRVEVAGDRLSEADETFEVALSNPQGDAVLGRQTATVTLVDDDGGTDLDGDGFADLVVGAQHTGDGDGAAYLFAGSESPPSELLAENASTLVPEDSNDALGVAVAGADVNGDGVDDAIVAAKNHASEAGAVYVFYGPELPSGSVSTADVKISGEAGGDHFGVRLATGDFNGDGIDDILASARESDLGGDGSGAGYVIFGSDSLPDEMNASAADAVIAGGAAGDELGYALDTAGDANGDGIEDVFIAARSAAETGQAYIFFGGDSLSGSFDASDAQVELSGANEGDDFGADIAGGADVTGDGVEDVVVSATPSSGSDTVYIYSGTDLTGAVGTTDAHATITSSESSFGFSINLLGDASGDGVGDLVVGSRLGGDSSEGITRIFFGGGGLVGDVAPSAANGSILGEASDDFFGSYTTGPFDVDANGLHDLVASAHNNGPGRVHVFLGGSTYPDGAADADIRIVGAEEGSIFGQALLP